MTIKQLFLLCLIMTVINAHAQRAAVEQGDKEAKIGITEPIKNDLNQIEAGLQDIEDALNNVSLERLYQTKLGSLKRAFMSRRLVSKGVGEFFADNPASKFYIKKFLKLYPDILAHADEFQVPEGGITAFKTFNQFFYRKLSTKGFKLRPLDVNPRVVTSPADCHLFVVPDLSKDPDFFVKDCKFNLETFLADELMAKQYADGTLLLFRLAPNDYHRFHFPFDCSPSRPKQIKGRFESVNPIAYTPTKVPQFKDGKQIYSSRVQPLTENERHLIVLKSDIFGEVLCVIIGAMMVGRIHETYVSTLKGRTILKKGEEMGYFAFGASSIALIFKPKAINVAKEFIENSSPSRIPSYAQVYQKYTKGGSVSYPESKIRVGQKVAVSIE